MQTLRISIYHIMTIGLVMILIGLLIPQTAVAKVPAGTDPNYPIEMTLAPYQISLRSGHLTAGQEAWFAVKVTNLGGELRQPLNLSLFTTPGDGNAIQKVHMDLFPGSYAEHWSIGHLDDITTFGEARLVERDGDGDPLLGELAWSGEVNNNETIFVCLRNDNGLGIDYWLFTNFITDVELDRAHTGPIYPLPLVLFTNSTTDVELDRAHQAVVADVGAGTDPNYPLPLADGVNWGALAPGTERWYSMRTSDLDTDTLEKMHLTFYFTPNDGNNLHQVHLDIFDAQQCQIWSRGEADEMVNMGAGSIESRDNNPETGELFWSGWLIDNDTYFVRVRNSHQEPINYWLFTADIINPSLGHVGIQ